MDSPFSEMPEFVKRQIGEKVDARSERLSDEFFAHWEKCRQGGMTDQRVVFEGWAIQKLAGLQLLVEDLVDWRWEQMKK